MGQSVCPPPPVLCCESVGALGNTALYQSWVFLALGTEGACHPLHEPQCLSYRNRGVA